METTVRKKLNLKWLASLCLPLAGIVLFYLLRHNRPLMDGWLEHVMKPVEQFFGRSYADSPDIDGRVWIATDEPLREGQFVKVQIDGTVDGDLSGFVLEE